MLEFEIARSKRYQRVSQGVNKPKFVILMEEKGHWLVPEHGSIVASDRDWDRFTVTGYPCLWRRKPDGT
jgi:hypothetical protein